MWEKRNLYSLYCGITSGVATLETSVQNSQKARDTCSAMFLSALSTVVKEWKPHQYLSSDEWTTKMCILVSYEEKWDPQVNG